MPTAHNLTAFLAAVSRAVVRLGPRDHLAVETLVRSRGEQGWTHGDLRASLASVLARNEEQWKQIARLFDDFAAGREPGGRRPEPITDGHDVVLGAEPAADGPEPWLARLRAARARWLETARNAPRGLWLGAVAGCLALLVAGGVWWLRPQEPVGPELPTLVGREAGAIEPDSLLPELELVAIERERQELMTLAPEVAAQVSSVPLPEAPQEVILGAALLALALASLGLRCFHLPAAAEDQRLRRVEQQRLATDRDRRRLEEEKAAAGRALELRYRVDEHLPVSRQAMLDSAELLGRLFREEHGADLDAEETLNRTVEAGGRFVAVMAPRHVRQELLVLVDVEEDSHPWLPGFQRLLEAWSAQGVVLRRYDFRMSPDRVVEAETKESLRLDELARRTEGLPLILFSRQLDPSARLGRAAWPEQLGAWPRRVWLDPDPRRRRELPRPRRQVLARLERLALPRLPLSDRGVLSVARHLAGGEEAVLALDEPLPELPARDADTPLAEALRKWALAGSLVPDPTWDQLEAIRRHFPDLQDEMPEPRYVQRLLECVERETGKRAEAGGGKGLAIPEAQQDAWLREQRRREAEGRDKGFEREVRKLLLAQLEATRPEDELDREVWKLKRAMHQAILEPKRARELLAWLDTSPLRHEGLRWLGAELRRQNDGVGAGFSPADTEMLEALVGRGHGVPLRALILGLPRLWGRVLVVAVPFAVLLAINSSGWGWDAALSFFQGSFEQQQLVKVPGTFHLVETDPALQPEMVAIDGGEFFMGSEESDRNDLPVHPVQVKPFAISRTEVTVAQYRRCVEAGFCSESLLKSAAIPNDLDEWGSINFGENSYIFINNISDCNWATIERNDYPINCITWFDAKRYSEWVGARLPTEAEWEYAARAGCATDYCDRNGKETTLDAVGWHRDSGFGSHPVAQLEANPWGLYDMIGNVSEWVEDDWHKSYEGAPENSRAWIDNPRASGRVIRGSSWGDLPKEIEVAGRVELVPSHRDHRLGFRVARSLPSALLPSDPLPAE